MLQHFKIFQFVPKATDKAMEEEERIKNDPHAVQPGWVDATEDEKKMPLPSQTKSLPHGGQAL
jgi:hypothetical protein